MPRRSNPIALANSPPPPPPPVWTIISFLCSFLNSESTRCSRAHLYFNDYLSLLDILKLTYSPPKAGRILFSILLACTCFAPTSVQPFTFNYSPSSVGLNFWQVWKLQSTKHMLLATCPFKIQVVNWLCQSDLDKIHAAVSHSSR